MRAPLARESEVRLAGAEAIWSEIARTPPIINSDIATLPQSSRHTRVAFTDDTFFPK
jgi:hypothetical protein